MKKNEVLFAFIGFLEVFDYLISPKFNEQSSTPKDGSDVASNREIF